MTTLEKLHTLIVNDIESYPIADAIASYCATKVGKSVSERDIKALEEKHPEFRFTLHKETGYFPKTSISGWVKEKWDDTRIEIRLADSGTGAKWPTVEDLKKDSSNFRYFGAKDERNAERAVALTDEAKAQGLKKVADLTDAFCLLHAELKAALEEYNLDEASVSYKVREIIKEETDEEVKFY